MRNWFRQVIVVNRRTRHDEVESFRGRYDERDDHVFDADRYTVLEEADLAAYERFVEKQRKNRR